ncbi:IS3 family transposase [Lysinibacillus fusiformis]|nr:IS3 family transposase [Lysinibacillus fusiformis]
MFKVFKTEFANRAHFSTLEQLVLDTVHWFNKFTEH